MKSPRQYRVDLKFIRYTLNIVIYDAMFILNSKTYRDFSLVVSVFANLTLGRFGCFDVDPFINNSSLLKKKKKALGYFFL